MVKTAEIAIADAHPSQAVELVDIYRRAWRLAYSGIIPSGDLERLIDSRDAKSWRRMVSAENVLTLSIGDALAGYATHGLARHPRHRSQTAVDALQRAEIYELYLSPEFQGVGLGEYLFEGCRVRFDERGLRGPDIWVLSHNQVARRFYHARGGRVTARAMHPIGRTKLEKVRYSWD
ncbi:MAG: GNAT family N-acetyltransferase [Pseudomonadota bacterium]